ncbi:MAG TPA: sigma factor, partial [Gemmatirosa sp.]
MGDAASLARLVPALYAIARQTLAARLRNVECDDLADLASEGVVKAVEHLHAARPVSATMFRAWVRAVVWRTALDAQRARGRRDAAWRAFSLDARSHEGEGSGTIADAASDAAVDAWPEAGDASHDTPLAVLARLAVDAQRELPPGAAVVLWAHLVTGAGWAEVAVLVGTTPAGAKRRYQRALASLRGAVWRAAPELPPAVRVSAL